MSLKSNNLSNLFSFFNKNRNPIYHFRDLLKRKISILDIGARDGLGWPWNSISPELIKVILVEPEVKEFEKLKKKNQNVVPYLLYEKETELRLNINNSPGTSSIYKPNKVFLEQFDNFERFEPKQILNFDSRTVDSLFKNNEIWDVDFAKIDIQGGELSVLKGGENFFTKYLIGLEVEVEFCEMYKDQPLFSEVDKYIRENLGMELWDIRKTYWKYKQKKYSSPNKGRLIFGDALYFRSLDKIEKWLTELDEDIAKDKVLSLIYTSIAYGYFDYAENIIRSKITLKFFSEKEVKLFIEYIDRIPKGFYPFKKGNKFLYRIFHALSKSFEPTHKGWAKAESNLGSRKKMFFWL